MHMQDKKDLEEFEEQFLEESDEEHEFSKARFKAVGFDFFAYFLSILISIVIGAGVGAYATAFAMLINLITGFRQEHMWLIFLLPAGGVLIVLFYHLLKTYEPVGTNGVLQSISSDTDLPIKMTPLITVGTAITHLFGGSAGREGAALQIGGSLGTSLAHLLKFPKKETIILTLCGMSAAFSAMFGTPLTATIFAMEVVSIGIIHYSAIVPCAVSALTASLIARLMGYGADVFPKVDFPTFTWLYGLKAILFGIACALVSTLFCLLLKKSASFMKKYIENPYYRTILGGILIVILTMIFGTSDYNGSGINIIYAALSGNAVWYSFIAKAVMTAITLAACYKGGEIIPTLFIGATFGCFFGPLIGIPASVGAALGMGGVFCGVTNCPITSIVLCFEIFGVKGLPMVLLVAAVSYRLSGYYGIYSGQKIMYSKSRPLFINRSTWK